MVASSTSPVPLAVVPNEAKRIFALQRAAVAEQGAPSHGDRIAALDALLALIKKHRRTLVETVSADFGNRSVAETELGELMPLVAGIRHVRRNLGRWMKPQRRRVALAFRPAAARVAYQPLGVVGVLSPWNYPLFLTLGPLIDALAAGNRVMLKPSELTPRTAALLQRLLGETFAEDRVAVVTGGPEVAAQFAALGFDHLLFSGKSPVLLCRDYPLKKAARTIAIGKFFNAGQTCVAPDYALVPADQADAFAEAVIQAAAELYPTIAGNADYTSIIADRQYQRLQGLIQDARQGGARVLQRPDDGAAAERKIVPTVLVGARDDAQALREEIFGPILPIVAYDDLDHAIRLINARPKPLALYCFSTDHAKIEGVLQRTSSGGATINGTMLHVTQEDLPFGGVGESGMGAYHGREGFQRLSHARAVLELGRFNMSDRIAAPYGKLTRMLIRALLGK